MTHFFNGISLYDTQNTFYFIVRGLKNVFLMPLTPLTDRKGGGVVDCPTQLNFMTWNCQLCSMINTSEKYERTQRGNLLAGLNAYGQPDRKISAFF